MLEDLEELNNATANFLAWIMSPFETHGLGDYFLKEFLKSAIKDYFIDDNIDILLKDIVFFYLDDTEIK